MTGSVSSMIMQTLTSEWQTARQIWDQFDCWGLSSVGTRLRHMAEDGEIERRMIGLSSEYRLKSTGQSKAR